MLRSTFARSVALLLPISLLGERRPVPEPAGAPPPASRAAALPVGIAPVRGDLERRAARQGVNVDPRGRSRTLPPGGTQVDSVRVQPTGNGNATAQWKMAGPESRIRMIRDAGTGRSYGVWESRASGRPVGMTVDTFVVHLLSAPSVRATYLDTVNVLAAVTATLSDHERRAVATTGMMGPADSVRLTITGTGSGQAPWTAAATGRRHATVLTPTQGTGSAWIRWQRDARQRPVGWSVDTITVVVREPGSSASAPPAATLRIIDSLEVRAATPAPTPLRIATSSGGRRATTTAGTSAPGDSVRVTLTGDGAASTRWRATARQAWIDFRTSEGTGDGWVRWNRASGGLSPGTYVDTISVRIEGATNVAVGTAAVVDTLVVAEPLRVAVGTGGRRDTATSGTAETRNDSATVSVTGASTSWSASAGASWLRLVTASGTAGPGAPGRLRWSRLTADLRPGTYVDTIVVRTANGLEGRLVDTLVVRAPSAVTADRAMAALRGTMQLPLYEARYLDLAGNADGVLNLGDVLAQLEREGRMPGALLRSEPAPERPRKGSARGGAVTNREGTP